MSKKIGVLALQGAAEEHLSCLRRFDVQATAVKTIEEINQLDGLILPGGESTAMGKLLEYFSLLKPLREKIRQGMPVWGTCAGLILLAKEIENQEKTYIGLMDIKAARNAYGGQMESFSRKVNLPLISKQDLSLVFIRAPYIASVGSEVQILGKLDERIIAAKQENMLVTAFHPELTDDGCFHQYFIDAFVK